MAPAAIGRERYRVGDLVVDVGQQRVTGPSGDIELPKLSFDLLLALVRRAPDFVSNDEMSAVVWSGVVVSPETVTKRVNLLRSALGDDPAKPRYVAGLRARGYRIVAPVSVLPDVGPVAASTDGPAAAHPPARTAPTLASQRSPPAQRIRIAALVLIVVLAAAALAWWSVRRDGAQAPPRVTDAPSLEDASVAVLPFENLSPSASDAYLAVGVPEMVLEQLSSVPRLIVIASGSTSSLDARGLDPRAVGRRLGARYIVLGSVQRAGSRLRVIARLIDTGTGIQAWSTQVDRDIADLFVVQDTIAAQVVDELRQRIDGLAGMPMAARHEPPVEAQLAYLQGRVLLGRYTVRGAEEAAARFSAAVALDPRFAAAEAGLFDARMLAAERRHEDLAAARAREMPIVQHAIEIDPNCGSAYVARAIWSGEDPDQRETDFRRGLELDPANGRGLVAYSEFLDDEGRYDEGARMLDRALLVDPRSPRVQFRKVMRQFDLQGAATLEPGMKQVLELDPDYQPALQRYAKYLWMRGELAEAVQIIEHAIEVDPENPWSRHTAAAIYLDLGDEDSARRVADGTPSSRHTEQILLGLYGGDWHAAGVAAYSVAGREYNLYESWGVPEAVRDYALRTGDYARAITYLENRYRLGGDQPALNIGNFRAAAYNVQLRRAAGDTASSKQLLDRLPAAIDVSVARYGTVFALRTKATVQLLAGDREAALRTLADSFASNDLAQWWYTLERDPLWEPLHADPVFVATVAQVRARVAREQAALASARSAGRAGVRGAGKPDGTR